VIEWRRVPWTLWVFSASLLLGAFTVVLIVPGQAGAKALYAILMLAWIFFLLKGVRWVWIVTLALSVLDLIGDLISDSLTWRNLLPGVIGMGLLVLPVTRRYYTRERKAALT
jgi:hypothetical protein